MTTRLWTEDGFIADQWRQATPGVETGAAEAAAPDDRAILPLAALLALPAERRAGRAVRVEPGEAIDALLPIAGELALVALAFPAFNDGRSFSKAEMLRAAGFRGPIRAVGDVLIDQLPHMLRTGFTEFEVSHELALARLAAGRTGLLPGAYQPSAAVAGEKATYAWRRRPSADG